MSVLIVDASVAAKWFIEEEFSEAALSVLDKKNQLHAPDFLLLEMDSILCKWVRRGAVSPSEASEVRAALRQYPLQRRPFTSLLDSAFAIAVQTRQSVYDCLYVTLAALLNGRMVTADRNLYDNLRNTPFKKNVLWVADIR